MGQEIRTHSADNIVGLAKHIIGLFFADHPEHETADLAACDAILSAMAAHLGHTSPVPWLGSGICHGNGDMSIVLELKP